MKNRKQLARTFRGEGVELGVAAGGFSETILNESACTKLWSVDRWSDHHGVVEYMAAAERLANVGAGRCVPLRMPFEEALPLFKDGSLDFIYVDGYAHTGQEGGKTLRNWWPKLKLGGVFAGHDYSLRYLPTVDAVNAFAATCGNSLNVTSPADEAGADEFPSWWIIKGAETEVSLPPPTWHKGCPVPPGSSVILVGNGPSILQEGLGRKIDSFDFVIRFNTYALKGFEEHTGTKTSLWSTFGRGAKPRDEGEIPPAAIYVHGEETKQFQLPVKDAWGLPRDFFNRTRDHLRSLSVRNEEGKKPLLPSSGLVVAAWLLETGVPQVTLAGFDHFSKEKSGLHHYWINRSFSKPPEHDGDAEALVFARWVAEGKVVYI